MNDLKKNIFHCFFLSCVFFSTYLSLTISKYLLQFLNFNKLQSSHKMNNTFHSIFISFYIYIILHLLFITPHLFYYFSFYFILLYFPLLYIAMLFSTLQYFIILFFHVSITSHLHSSSHDRLEDTIISSKVIQCDQRWLS